MVSGNEEIEESSCDLKLVLLGESSVGKSSVVSRYVTGKFNKTNATIGAAFITKEIKFVSEEGEHRVVNLEIWDTAGQERYRSLAPMYYRNTDVAVIVFDLTVPDSAAKALAWVDELLSYVEKERREEIVITVVGNKNDLIEGDDKIDSAMEQDIATLAKRPIWRVSAKTGEGIEELFQDIVRSIPKEKFRTKAQQQEATARNKHVTLNPDSSAWHRITERTTCEC
ncbi:hypothetical protein TPHA_0I02590 [Tetrapisispora phaffii CBS 4417]|uniref:Uncharacterized protein n=1 Tax=Tetrapisispora phaffii (strain ATCC 24235 / CBS 4417 / NBRC 1672 / NRRL Y-8282 / UCD 70-5) TaxID=1071381 RepID=G8BXY2_TETPH|nr:hypothetical protein TPHA_0I02590 [Tetrapisispora phaffii CBS 4417]CCE64760.1 hypothetical protein TPHA_0I02590 [Tetrapisispora phaffii CBS 4417]